MIFSVFSESTDLSENNLLVLFYYNEFPRSKHKPHHHYPRQSEARGTTLEARSTRHEARSTRHEAADDAELPHPRTVVH